MPATPTFDASVEAYKQGGPGAGPPEEAGAQAAENAPAVAAEEAEELKRKVGRLKKQLLIANQHITKFQKEIAAKDEQLRVLLPEASTSEVR